MGLDKPQGKGRGKGKGKGNGKGKGKGKGGPSKAQQRMSKNKFKPGGNDKKKTVKIKRPKMVAFDEAAREEYLTGFRKRKAARRKFGLDMQAFKDKKALQEERKAKRQVLNEKYEAAMKQKLDQLDDVDCSAAEKKGLLKAKIKKPDVKKYSDPFIASNFGASAVTVTTTFGFAEEDELESIADFKKKSAQRQESTFQRIQRKSEGTIKPLKQLKREKQRQKSKSETMQELNKKKKKGRNKIIKGRRKEQEKNAKRDFASKAKARGAAKRKY